jgi:hypothetical protein
MYPVGHMRAFEGKMGGPVPTRFPETVDSFLIDAKRETELSTSEIVRRAVRLLHRKQQLLGSYRFIVEDLAK